MNNLKAQLQPPPGPADALICGCRERLKQRVNPVPACREYRTEYNHDGWGEPCQRAEPELHAVPIPRGTAALNPAQEFVSVKLHDRLAAR